MTPNCTANQDFADRLPSGYRFNPTDFELIVDYLKAKIESRKLPECRLHEVNIYNHNPEELTRQYRSSENKWYFLTPRDRRYAHGNRPKRAVGRFGSYWKATQKLKAVCDPNKQVVGYKRDLKFYIDKDNKTSWLMHEYIAEGPNLGTGQKLDDWVLCKIYYKGRKSSKSKKVIKQPNQTDHDDVLINSSSMEPQTPLIQDVNQQQDVGKSCDQDSATLLEDIMQNGWMVALDDQDVADCIPQTDGYNAAISTRKWTLDSMESYFLED